MRGTRFEIVDFILEYMLGQMVIVSIDILGYIIILIFKYSNN